MRTSRRTFVKMLLGAGALASPWTGWSMRLGQQLDELLNQPTRMSYAREAEALTPADYLKRTAMEDITFLAQPGLGGRRAGTAGETLAADYLSQQLSGMGLKPMGEDGTYLQAFTVPGMSQRVLNGRVTFRPTGREELRIPCTNVGGGLPGELPEEVIMLSAHYDHLGVFQGELYPGANDNASGVGCVLEVMRRLVRENIRPKRTVMAAFWSAEEMGFLGSSAFIQRPTVPLSNIKAVLNVDTVGNGKPGYFSLWGTNNPATRAVQAAAQNLGAQAKPMREGHNSDQITFAQGHIPAVTLLSRDWLDRNHTPRDTVEQINTEQLNLAVEIIYQAVKNLAFK